MRTQKFSKTARLAAIIVAAALPIPSFANPAIIQSIQRQQLPLGAIKDLGEVTRAVQKAAPTDFSVFQQLRLGPPLSGEGIPVPNDQPDVRDLVESAYSTPKLIEKALKDAQGKGIGQRIRTYENYAGRILRRSGQKTTEILVRLTLNRSVDVMQTVLPIAGNNPDAIALWAANFYEESFNLAAMLANNPAVASYTGDVTDVAQFLQNVSLAEFGRIYSSLLFRFTASLSSDSSKAVMLMKLVGYLGWDCNNDLRRREVKEVIADIYSMQHDPGPYQGAVETIARGLEPRRGDLANLRNDVFELLKTLPQRFQEAGIPVLMARPTNQVPTSFLPFGLQR